MDSSVVGRAELGRPKPVPAPTPAQLADAAVTARRPRLGDSVLYHGRRGSASPLAAIVTAYLDDGPGAVPFVAVTAFDPYREPFAVVVRLPLFDHGAEFGGPHCTWPEGSAQ